MSSQEPPRESSSSSAPIIETNISIPGSSTNLPSTTASTTAVNPVSSAEPANEEPNSSIGSQRSLNSRLFPFRFSRDILINNVGSLPLDFEKSESSTLALGPALEQTFALLSVNTKI